MSFQYSEAGNYIDKRDEYFISYRPHDKRDPWLGSRFESASNGETAIVTDDAYYILNGDWRERYASASTLNECLTIFHNNSKHKSSFSN